MNRAKLVATAFIGVVAAANSFESAEAQTLGKFIVQPQKSKQPVAPETPVAVPPAPANTEPTVKANDPVQPVQAPSATPAPASAVEVSPVDAASAASKQTEPKEVPALSFGSLDAFPSLQPATKPDLSFDSLGSLATVPSTEFEAEVAKFATKPAVPSSEHNMPEHNTSEHKTSGLSISGLNVEPPLKTGAAPSNAIQQNAPTNSGSGSSQLQWTARPAGSRTPFQPTANTNSAGDSSYNSIPPRTQQPLNSASNFNSTNATPAKSTDLLALQAAQEQAAANNQLLTKIADRVEAIESKIIKADEPEERSRTRAALVSSRITNDPRFAIEDRSELNVGRLESPQGWQAVGGRLTAHVKNCESLLRRGAFCSAREEAESACVLLIRHIDLIDNLYRCEPAWQAAKQSLTEADDFLAVQRVTDSEGLRRLIDSHHTPILKGKNLAEMSPLTAAQHYRVYAELQLVEATQGHPWASELLYAVGRTYQSEADVDPRQVDALRMKALAYYRAARATLPSNAVACNQLGYLLLQMDRNEEAREVLAAAVTQTNDVASLSNLAEASRRLGDTQTVAWAAQSVAAIRSRSPQQPPTPAFVELTAEEFAAISPRSIGPKPATESTNNGPTAPVHKSATAPGAFQLR